MLLNANVAREKFKCRLVEGLLKEPLKAGAPRRPRRKCASVQGSRRGELRGEHRHPVRWAGRPGPTSWPSRAVADVAPAGSLAPRLTLSRCCVSSVSTFRHLSR